MAARTQPLYLDHNATTPLDPAVFAAMTPYFLEHFGNPSSVEHAYGQLAGQAVERARTQVADAIGASPSEILFTGSCTESNNLAILGVGRALSRPGHFVTSEIEHPAVLQAFKQLEREGHRVTFLGVDGYALVRLEELETALAEETTLVSIMAANNEVGTLQPLPEIGALCAARGVLFHSDLAQVMTCEDVNVRRDCIDLASISAHKAYGPKGVGALFIRRGRPRIKLEPLMWGGGQEKSLRPGTLNTPLIVGLGEAMALARGRRDATRSHLLSLGSALLAGLQDQVGDLDLNGHHLRRLAGNVSVSIDGVEPLALMRLLRESLCFSASSACATEKMETSPVLLAMFGDSPRARRAFRLSPGRDTNVDDIQFAIEKLGEATRQLRKLV